MIARIAAEMTPSANGDAHPFFIEVRPDHAVHHHVHVFRVWRGCSRVDGWTYRVRGPANTQSTMRRYGMTDETV